MRQKVVKIYLAGVFLWLGLVIVLLVIWNSVGFTRRLTEMTFDGSIRTIELPETCSVILSQTDPGVTDGSFDGNVWFKIKGDTSLRVPELRMVAGMEKIVKWSATDDGVLSVELDVSEVETPQLNVHVSAPVVLALPMRSEWRISVPEPVPVLGKVVVESLNVKTLRLDVLSGVRLSFVEADTLDVTLLKPTETVLEDVTRMKHGFMDYLYDTNRPLTLEGSTIGVMTLAVGDPGVIPGVRLEVCRETVGRGVNKRTVGEIDSLYVRAFGSISGQELTLSYDGVLPRVMDFEPGIANSVEIITKDNYTLVTEPENVKKDEDDN